LGGAEIRKYCKYFTLTINTSINIPTLYKTNSRNIYHISSHNFKNEDNTPI